MKKFNVVHLIIFTVLYGLVSIFTYMFLTFEGLSIWMGINVGFAMIPLIVIVYLYQRFQENMFKIDVVLIIGLIVFFFFYPNAFYILTDFMHIDSLDFYYHEVVSVYPEATKTVYRLIIDPYFMMFHIIVSASIGAYAGIQSLLYLEEMVKQKFENKVLTNFVVVFMLVMSSLGIYLGRFLRFFSFDILRPFYLLKTFFNATDLFTFSFVFFFSIFEIIIFYGYKILVIKLPDEN